MKFIRSYFAFLFILTIAFTSLYSCKAKKLAQKPAPVAEIPKPVVPPTVAAKPMPAAAPAAVAPVKKPNYTFSNIQFEFNTAVLKTNAYPILDKTAMEMKMDPSAKFYLKGYASIEGTEAHNMSLSEDRANSVKTYLINSGINSNNIIAKGFGTSNPIGDNSTEAGKELNRRVEIMKQN
jgi:OOP family OmpA-OmpF porin